MVSKSSLQQCANHLKKHNLWGKKNTENVDVVLRLPELLGKDLDAHFKIIAEKQVKPYKELLHKLTHSQLPCVPSVFSYSEGWTQYLPDGTSVSVSVPDCDAFVFDVEVSVQNGNQPTLAAAVSDKFWYTWCSHQLLGASADGNENENSSPFLDHNAVVRETTQDEVPNFYEDSSDATLGPQKRGSSMELDDLIPFGGGDPKMSKSTNQKPKIIVGHNVSYDRVRVREQYYIPNYPLRFVDTMSLHIAVSGLVQEQRAMIMKNKTASKKVYLPWMSVGSINNLNDVYKFYCKKEELQKEERDVFISGTLEDIRNDFQNLMAYCTRDVIATHEVLVNLLPLFYERCPHPVSFGGILEMGSSYLPVSNSWNKYIESAEKLYSVMQNALSEKLSERAAEALKLRDDKLYENDPWLWNLDWNVMVTLKKKGKNTPNWYVKLCKMTGEREGTPEPANMSTSLRVVPKLLRLTWKNYPLHHEKDFGWGYLRPKYPSYQHFMEINDQMQSNSTTNSSDVQTGKFPLKEFYSICPVTKPIVSSNKANDIPETQEEWEQILYGVPSKKKLAQAASYQNVESTEDNPIDIGIPGVEFIRLPHKNGPRHNVGNPLAKDFLHKIEDGTLSSHIKEVAELVLRTTKSISYWRNSRDRILSQNTVWLDKNHLPSNTLQSEEFNEEDPECKWGAILPQVVVCGTVTRRAVERTWLTASNARADRIGSELKSMVTAPPGYHFVGADVDSQELWIAALLGDASFAEMHGGTAMAWMTLQGSKAEGTDLHSRTAATAHITRDQAKVINYSRIYGAGLRFLQTLLLQFNSSLGPAVARQRAEAIMTTTKGEKGWRLSEEGRQAVLEYLGEDVEDKAFTRKQINGFLRRLNRERQLYTSFANITQSPAVWVNGSESFTFNCLESIVRQKRPESPVLGAAIPKPLEPEYAGIQHMTSRMNWVVQSSAVDYLHLMTVCMRWLAERYDINMRFSISIHDEVRYLVASEDRYRAALALQITNLLTRSLFALR
ncbi:DNA-directed DNA polymerase family A palm domain [Trinorchestia longiramus]|nr:DNA-directed DNA polymerase family A palm domain [Trinorchestia longiramus]